MNYNLRDSQAWALLSGLIHMLQSLVERPTSSLCLNHHRTPMTPPVSVYVASARFSDGTKVSFGPTDIVVLVGPNNCGKSVALENLEMLSSNRKASTTVVTDCELRTRGTAKKLVEWLRSNSTQQPRGTDGGFTYRRLDARAEDYRIGEYWASANTGLNDLSRFFVRRLSTEDRLGASRPAKSIALLHDPFTHPIHFLQANDALEARISSHFRQAFGLELIVHRNAGSEVPLLCGNVPQIPPGKDRLSLEYLQALDSLAMVHKQGDGIRSFVGILLNTLLVPEPCILIDEPEAFLHPPQARLLGRMLAEDTPASTQLFLATHSGDLVRGLLDAGSQRVRIVRLTRSGNKNPIQELPNNRLADFWSDPILRHSNILDGLFHDAVVACESDADARFYSAMIDAVWRGGGREYYPDLMFVNGSGKDRLAVIVRALRQVGVKVMCVADLDVLNDRRTIRALAEAFDVAWEDIERDWNVVTSQVQSGRLDPEVEQIRARISEVLNAVTGSRLSEGAADAIRALVRRPSAWSTVKTAGLQAVPQGDATQACIRLICRLKNAGLFLVEVGELEGFCRSVPGHGPAWVNGVLLRDLLQDEELRAARAFAGDLLAAGCSLRQPEVSQSAAPEEGLDARTRVG